MNVPSNIGKSILLAYCVFWIIIFTDDYKTDLLALVLLSLIPIAISVTLVIIITICPLFWAFQKKESDNKSAVFKKCFPYYAIVVFSLCLLGVFNAENETPFISFFITVFITTSQSWVWFAKERNV